jgi:hypothetical protein
VTFVVSPTASRLALAALLLAMPFVAISTLVNLVLQENTIDPYVYTGLIHDYIQVLGRYGSTYYANRVAFTVPTRAAIALLGDEHGHFLFESLYLLAATLSGFALGQRYFSTGIGVVGAAWVAFNPWVIRTLTWDYPEGAAVCAMLVTFCCFSVNRYRPVALHAAGGAVFALACNANPFVIVMAVAFAPPWLILNLPKGARHCVACALSALAALILGYSALIVVEYLEFPGLGFGRELVTLGVGVNLLRGGAAVWYRPLSDVLAEGRVYIVMPAFLLAALAIMIAFDRISGRQVDRFAVASAAFLALTCAFYLLFHGYLRTAVVNVPWYDGYAFPAGLFAIIALLGACARALRASGAMLLNTSAVMSFGLLWLCFSAWSPLLGSVSIWALAALAVGLVIVMANGRFPALRAAAALAFAVLAIAVFYYNAGSISAAAPARNLYASFYSDLHDSTQRGRERELYEGAEFLQRIIAETLPLAEGPVGFWYSAEPKNLMFNNIQSVFLFGYSRVIRPALPQDPNEHLDAELRQDLAHYAHIAILSRTPQEGDTALQTLGADGGVTHLRARFTFPAAQFGFVTTIVDYLPPTPPVGPQVAVIPLDAVKAQNNAILNSLNSGILIQTAPEQWAYSAIAPLPLGGRPPPKLVLRIRLRSLQGKIGLAIATQDLAAPLIVETGVAPTAEPRDIDLEIPDGAAARQLIIRNWSPTGISLAEVSSITLFRAPQ